MITAEGRLIRISVGLSQAVRCALRGVVFGAFCRLQTLSRLRFVSKSVKKFPIKFTLVLPIAAGSGLLKLGSTKNSSDIHQFLQLVDELDAAWRHEDEYSVIQSHLSDSDESLEKAELLWRLARAAFQLSQKPTLGKSQRRKLVEEALHHVLMSLQINNKDPNAHVWCSIIMEAEVMFRSIGEQVQSAAIIREHLDFALQRQPEDPLTQLTTAIWCYSIAKLTWVERRIGTTVQPSFPTSSWEEALKHFETGESASAVSAGCRHLLIGAQCCLHFGQTDKARSLLQRAVNIPVRTVEDMKSHKEAVNLLRKL